MPTYEYRCNACGHRFERLQKFSDEPVRTCPECGEEAAERLISSGGGLVFKGSGFYATDYRKDGGKKRREEASGDGDDGERTSGGKEQKAGGEGSAADAPASSSGDDG